MSEIRKQKAQVVGPDGTVKVVDIKVRVLRDPATESKHAKTEENPS